MPAVLSLTAPPSVLAETRGKLRDARVPVLATPERAATAIASLPVRDAEHRARRTTAPTARDTPIPSTTAGAAEVGRGLGEGSRRGSRAADAAARGRRHARRGTRGARRPHGPRRGRAAARRRGPQVGGRRRALRRRRREGHSISPWPQIDRTPDARYLVEGLAPRGPELLLGARRDPVFRPLVVLASGGTAVEANDNVPSGEARAAPARRRRGHAGRSSLVILHSAARGRARRGQGGAGGGDPRPGRPDRGP